MSNSYPLLWHYSAFGGVPGCRALLLCCRAEGSGLSGSRRKIASKNSLAGMFEPPRDLMFEGDFEHAKAEAEKRSVWLVRIDNQALSLASTSIPTSKFQRRVISQNVAPSCRIYTAAHAFYNSNL